MPKFRKKPVIIDAEQFFPDRTPWPAGVIEGEITLYSNAAPPVTEMRHIVRTLEGDHICSPGDWIITGVKGERYPCKPDIFEATYECVVDDDPQSTALRMRPDQECR